MEVEQVNVPSDTTSTGFKDDGNANRDLGGADFTNTGELKTTNAALALVVGSAQDAREFISNKQYNLLWKDADWLFQAPRPHTAYDNTYTSQPNVTRFTVAKIVNAVIPQLYKGLFYDDPPMLMRPRPGTPQIVTDAKSALFSYILDECRFKQQTKWGMETMAHLGTGIWKWGIDWKDVTTHKRTATALTIPTGPDNQPEVNKIPEGGAPKITTTTKAIRLPFFEHRPLDKVLVDPHLEISDVREAAWVVDVHYMDFYQLEDIRKALADSDDPTATKGWSIPANLKNIWTKTNSANANNLQAEQAVYVQTAVHHAKDQIIQAGPDPLRKKLEVLEYWDKKRKIIVIDNTTVLYEGDNEFGEIPFLSCNWWNRPKAFFGMGISLVIGQNQRVDQGTINAILKILDFGVNPIYLQKREANTATQMIRTGIGKIMKVDGDADKAFHLMEQPHVDPNLWTALKESQDASESASGADQQLVQGSTAGPRAGMGRTSGGAAIQASASATRLDGPLDNFIEQVFKPFLGVLDMLVFKYMHDEWILHILGKEMGEALVKDLSMQDYWDANIEFEVLAGSSAAARRTMAQSMVMLTQFLENPQLAEKLAEINGVYIDYEVIFKMWMEASEWKNGEDILKPLTPEMKQKLAANSPAAQMQMKQQAQDQASDKKFQQKTQLQSTETDDRIKRDLVVAAAKTSFSEGTEGEANSAGLQGSLPNV